MPREHRAAGGPHPADDRLRETIVGSTPVHEGRYLAVRVDDIVTPDGRRSTRDIVEHPGAVAVVALDDEERVLLVRQFRLAAGRTLLEIPAGTLDRSPDGALEDPDLAARRELEEETGFRAGRWEHLGAFWTAPGFATELMHLYLARDLVPADADRLGPDEDEQLELDAVPWRDAVALAERGEIADAKSIVGLLRLARILEAGGHPATAGVAGGAPSPSGPGSASPAARMSTPADAPADGEPGAGETAVATWQMTAGRLIQASALIVRSSLAMQVIGWVGVAAGLFTLVSAADPTVWLPPLVFGVAAVTGYFSAPFAWWQTRRRPDLVKAVNRLSADASGVRISAFYGTGGYGWSTFRRVRERSGWFFLDSGAGANIVVPADAFDAGGLAAFRRLLLDAGFSPDGKPIARG